MPWLRKLGAWRDARLAGRASDALDIGLEVVSVLCIGALFLLSSMMLAAGTYNPFIYFRF